MPRVPWACVQYHPSRVHFQDSRSWPQVASIQLRQPSSISSVVPACSRSAVPFRTRTSRWCRTTSQDSSATCTCSRDPILPYGMARAPHSPRYEHRDGGGRKEGGRLVGEIKEKVGPSSYIFFIDTRGVPWETLAQVWTIPKGACAAAQGRGPRVRSTCQRV